MVIGQQSASLTGPSADPRGGKTMLDKTFGQVRELLTNYGKIDVLWYDGGMRLGGRDPAKYYSHQ